MSAPNALLDGRPPEPVEWVTTTSLVPTPKGVRLEVRVVNLRTGEILEIEHMLPERDDEVTP